MGGPGMGMPMGGPGMPPPGMPMGGPGMAPMGIPGYVPPRPGVPPVYPGGIPQGMPMMAVGPGMYIKNNWSEKREKKLSKMFYKVNKDGRITPHEICKVLDEFGYKMNEQQGLQFLYMIDRNRDGVIQWEEFRDGVRSLVQSYPKCKKDKHGKDKYKHDKHYH
eukprot:m51a1_g11141 hypothetical protein (163) ;mRNA; r:201618-202366